MKLARESREEEGSRVIPEKCQHLQVGNGKKNLRRELRRRSWSSCRKTRIVKPKARGVQQGKQNRIL